MTLHFILLKYLRSSGKNFQLPFLSSTLLFSICINPFFTCSFNSIFTHLPEGSCFIIPSFGNSSLSASSLCSVYKHIPFWVLSCLLHSPVFGVFQVRFDERSRGKRSDDHYGEQWTCCILRSALEGNKSEARKKLIVGKWSDLVTKTCVRNPSYTSDGLTL